MDSPLYHTQQITGVSYHETTKYGTAYRIFPEAFDMYLLNY